jgi:hypothetical protein
MLLEKGHLAILPCAGITLIRSAGLISAFPAFVFQVQHPGTCLFPRIRRQALEASRLHWKSRTDAKVARNTFKML